MCDEIIEFDKHLCDSCNHELEFDTIVRFIPYQRTDEVIRCISYFRYRSKLRNAILRFKFSGHKEYARIFAKIISEKIFENCRIEKFDYICAVPLSEKRILERGYNQSELLAQEISKILNIPVANVIEKPHETFIQHELSAEERSKNLLGAFSIIKGSDVRGKNFILCDDIITTGNTLKECVKVLKDHGANEILCCTIASI